MVSDVFGTLLDGLGTILKTRLSPDKNGDCRIRFPNEVIVTLEMERGGEHLIIVSELGVPPLGRYRENLFREALKANGLPPPRVAIFAYSKRKDALVLYARFPTLTLTAQMLADRLSSIQEQAEPWKTAITRGEIPSLTGSISRRGGGIFGL